MSTEKRKKVTREMMEKEMSVDPLLKKQSLQTAIYDVTKSNPFMGSVLQCLDIGYTLTVPRAGIMFDSDAKKWVMMINAHWYAKLLDKPCRKGVLLHEMMHITHKHPSRAPFLKLNPNRRQLMNIAMDMSINQYIANLPKGCQQCPPHDSGQPCKNELCPGSGIFVEDYYDFDKDGNKVPWEKNKPMEFYYMKLIKRYEDGDKGEGGGGEGGGGGGKPEEFDSHNWDSNSEESDMLDATEDLVKRAIQKQGLSYDNIPQFAKDLLDSIKARRAELNYKQLILAAIKKNASGFNREHSWTRRSRRYGNKAPGTRNGKLPKVEFMIDSSGSISVQEANDFLEIGDEFMKVGSRDSVLHLWHTQVYYTEKHKLHKGVPKALWQTGGTDVTPVIKTIIERKADLVIVLTDGCYGDVDFEHMLNPGEHMPQILWIISKDGWEDHPLKRTGETIKIPDTEQLSKDKNLEQQ